MVLKVDFDRTIKFRGISSESLKPYILQEKYNKEYIGSFKVTVQIGGVKM